MSRTRSWAICFYGSYAWEFELSSIVLRRLLSQHHPNGRSLSGWFAASPEITTQERAKSDRCRGGDETRLDIHSRLTNFNTRRKKKDDETNRKIERRGEFLRFISADTGEGLTMTRSTTGPAEKQSWCSLFEHKLFHFKRDLSLKNGIWHIVYDFRRI